MVYYCSKMKKNFPYIRNIRFGTAVISAFEQKSLPLHFVKVTAWFFVNLYSIKKMFKNEIMLKKILYSISVLAFALLSCTGGDKAPSVQESASCCEDSAMAHFIQQPERAISLLDSAVMLRRLTPQRAGYLKAIVTYNGLNNPDSCIAICQKMLDDEVWEGLPTSDDQVTFQVEVYELMATAAYTTSDLLAIVRYCKAGIQLAHGRNDLKSDEADMLSRMGTTLVSLGKPDEGLKALDEARNMVLTDNHWPSVLTYLNIAKKYRLAYMLTEDYEGACRVAKEALLRLDELKHNPGRIEGIPGSMLADSTALEEFVQYYYAPLTAFLAKAYTRQGMLDSALVWYQRFTSCPQNDKPTMSFPIIEPLIAFGKYQDALQRIASAKDFLANDTLSADYIDLLKYELDISSRLGRTDSLLSLSMRIQSLTDIRNKQEFKTLLANSTMELQLQQEQLRRKDAEEKSLTMTIIAIAVLSLLLLSAALNYIHLIRRRHTRLSAELENAKTEIQTLKKKGAELADAKPVTVTPAELYRRACIVMENDQPFLDSKYTIDDMARQTFTNKAYLSAAINQLSGMTFRNWLAKYRVEYAKRILLETPDISNAKLSKMCGFDGRNSFYRQFGNVEGMSPTEWLNAQKGQTEQEN